jgi:hypothetical protein
MPDYQPIDYRLRCHTKRTDLPVDVLRDIGEAYAEIGRLQRERDEARREVCGFHHLTGFLAGDYANSREWDCFPNRDYEFEPSVKDFKLFLEGQDKIFLERIDRLTAERDEARREVCSMNETGLRMNESDKKREAKRRGWDCFKENTND